jgi:CheY-like chemotaxis protein
MSPVRRENRRLAAALRERTAEFDYQKTVTARQQEQIEKLLHPPAPPPKAAGRITPAAGSERDRPLRVLLAEDNAVNQMLALKAIEKMGHSVVVVGNGADAVRVHADQHFDLILMDLQMPEMDGFAATSAIRENETGSSPTPIVAVTAHAMHGDRERCLAAGMTDYISKPIDLKALGCLIERVSGAPDSGGQWSTMKDHEIAAGAPPGERLVRTEVGSPNR